MKKIVLTTALDSGLVSTPWAVETMNIHKRVNNAQTPTHQIQSASVPSAIQGETSRMAGMNQREQVIVVHKTMNNGSVEVHQKTAGDHQKMTRNTAVNDTRSSASLAATNERKRAAVAHETMNND